MQTTILVFMLFSAIGVLAVVGLVLRTYAVEEQGFSSITLKLFFKALLGVLLLPYEYLHLLRIRYWKS